MEWSHKLRVFGTVNDSIVDGPGIRYVIFTQGCHHHCPGCHNPDSHAVDGGYDKHIADILKEIDANPLLDGVTLSGGEPILHAGILIPLCREIKKRGLNLVIYSGYTWGEIQKMGEPYTTLIKICDMLIDGKFVIAQRNLTLLYRGSNNQRLVNIKESIKNHVVVTYEPNVDGEIEI